MLHLSIKTCCASYFGVIIVHLSWQFIYFIPNFYMHINRASFLDLDTLPDT